MQNYLSTLSSRPKGNSKFKIKVYKILPFLIILVAALLRLWNLDSNPPHLTSDEAALGYNAYSILKTAKDEHGKFLPIVFESFGDWKPGLYVYLTVPFVAILGLNEWAVRLPGALSGVLAVWLVYFVVYELLWQAGPATGFLPASARPSTLLGTARVLGALPPVSPAWIALFSAFFLAISPWHIQFSRGGWEAGVSLTLTLLGIYFFLLAIRGKPNRLLFSAASFALTLWIYQGAKLATLVVVLGLLIAFRAKFFSLPRSIIFKSFLVGLLLSTPIILSVLQGKGSRLGVYSVFSYPRSQEAVQGILDQNKETRSSAWYSLYHREPLNFARGVVERWLNYYSGRFLFFEGDWQNKRHSVPNTGVILLMDSVFVVAGFVLLLRMRGGGVFFLWWWLVLAPLPAVLSRDLVHGVRSLNMVVPLTILVALGAYRVFSSISSLGDRKGKVIGLLGFWLVGLMYLVNYVYYLDQYWVHAPKENSREWQFGYKDLVGKVSKLQGSFSEVVIQQGYDQPYIFFLFYNKYNPDRYQKLAGEVFVPSEYGDVGLVKKLGNITFRHINWPEDRGLRGTLFAADTLRIPVEDSSDEGQFRVFDRIEYLDGTVAFRFVEIL